MTIEYKDSKRIETTVNTDADYKVHSFTSSGTFAVTGSGDVEYLVVAGGGGGAHGGGGAGAGGYLTSTGHGVTAQSYTITVGTGGTGSSSTANGGAGTASSFSTITSTGGGGGGKVNTAGQSGGSGGGAGGNGGASSGGSPTAGQGFIGGGTTGFLAPYSGSGGGGAGAKGDEAPSAYVGSDGGAGLSSSITGSAVFYSGGGGGGVYQANASNVGGAGGSSIGGAGCGTSGCTAGNGTINTGSGGGGAEGSAGLGGTGGNGGSGIVIIRYLTSSSITATGGTITTISAPAPTIKPTNVQDNSILVEKDTANRYWFDAESETESTGTFSWDGKVTSADNNNQGFYVANTSSVVYGKKIESVSFWLKKVGSPTGTAYCRVWGNSGSGTTVTQLHEFGSIDSSTLASSYTKYTFDTGSYTLAVGDTVGIAFTGSSASTDLVGQLGNLTAGFDSGNTYRGRKTASTWSPVSSHNIKFAVTYPTWTMNPTYEDDFSSYTTQASADASWVSLDTAKNRVNISTKKLDFNIVRDGTSDDIDYDFGTTVSDTAWVLRYKMVMNNPVAPSQYINGGSIGLSSNTGINTMNIIGFGLEISNYTCTDILNGTPSSSLNYLDDQFSHTPTAETLYVEIIRTSATSYTIELFSDSNYSISVEKKTVTNLSSSIVNLRYFHIRNFNNGANVGGSLSGTIDDIEFYNGVTSIN